MTPSSYAFTRTPKWVAGHALALIGIIVFVQLGLWQLRSLDERREFNTTVEPRRSVEYVPLGVALSDHGPEPEELQWRRVETTGTFVIDEEVIVQGRSRLGQSGHHVATPLLLDDGRAIIVNRGWVPIDAAGPPVIGAEPPAGIVTVRGVIRQSQTRGAFGPSDPLTGVLDRVARVDVARLGQQSGLDLHVFYIDLEELVPAQPGAFPAPVEPPEIGEGPHLSYAVQWFAFAALVVIGYPILLYRTARWTGYPPAPL